MERSTTKEGEYIIYTGLDSKKKLENLLKDMYSEITRNNTIKTMQDPRRQKINLLKDSIKESQKELKELTGKIVEITNTEEYTNEEKADKRKEVIPEISKVRAAATSLVKELQVVRMNKNSSSFFEWHPHPGMNRRKAREFRHLRKADGRSKVK